MENQPTSREEFENACNELFTYMKMSHKEIVDLIVKVTGGLPDEGADDLLATYSLEEVKRVYRLLQHESLHFKRQVLESQKERGQVQCWEYYIIRLDGDSTKNAVSFNHLGQFGWELVSVDNNCVYFKRPDTGAQPIYEFTRPRKES